MKKFIIRLIYFFFPLLIIGTFMEVSLRKITNDYSYKKNYLDKNAEKVQVLILGSSHTYYGINPAYIHYNSFNAAHVSQTLNIDWEILKKYNSKWNALKYIIIPIDYTSLFESLDLGVEKWRMRNYSVYSDISITNDFSDNFAALGNPKINLVRLYNFYTNRNYSEITCSTSGFGTAYNYKDREKDLDSSSKIAAERHLATNDNCLQENITILDSIISFAKQKDIKLIYITCPAYDAYTNLLNSNQLTHVINCMNNLSRANSNIFYHNFLKDSLFSTNDFFDADHLNDSGAKKFTKRIDSLYLH